ncbi:Unannotated [Lentimonas sp. CC4]|nr:Unannotated [Lentimonas sp. CC4]CAA6685423.1 Unannotated [Lentimonas sp. CC6]CAA7076871.1 Unannotated [Lentimonas sp. CC4]CAA7170731.1 Unannotated [Lentimonas sp. CC21]CAA7179707.1 Unannotated [Lentimonas sp. CC8]
MYGQAEAPESYVEATDMRNPSRSELALARSTEDTEAHSRHD